MFYHVRRKIIGTCESESALLCFTNAGSKTAYNKCIHNIFFWLLPFALRTKTLKLNFSEAYLLSILPEFFPTSSARRSGSQTLPAPDPTGTAHLLPVAKSSLLR